MIVVDASALLEVLLRTPAAAAVESRLFGGETLHAPHLLDLEVAHVLRRHERSGGLGARRAAEALRDLEAFVIERYAHHLLLRRVWSLRANATAYDAGYLALAEVPGHSAVVEVIEV